MLTKDKKDHRQEQQASQAEKKAVAAKRIKEIGGPKGLEPTRYGDWERKGRCIDF